MEKSTNNRDVKRSNRIDTLRAILEAGRVSQPALAARLGHSGPTVLQNVRELMALGLVEEAGEFESTGGRKARAFAPVRTARAAAGLEITRAHVGAVVIDLSGALLHHERLSVPFELTAAYPRRHGEIARGLPQRAGVPAVLMLGVGDSLPGAVDATETVLISSHVLGLRNVATENFTRYVPGPCSFINDANAAGLAEARGRADLDSSVYLSLSNSVGGAIFTGGRLYMGGRLRAGEFGHNTLVPDGRPCYCGKRGCLDAYCNAELLSGLTGGNLAAFFEGVRAGDERLTAAWREYLEHLAVAVNNLYMTFDCPVVAGGYVGSYLEEFGGGLRELLAQRNTFEPDASYLKFCRYKVGASAVGAALLRVEDFLLSL